MISAVVLAAGKSARMGQTKLLLPVLGRPMVRVVGENALRSQSHEVIFVVGHDANRVGQAITACGEGVGAALARKLKVVENPDFSEGQSTSVRTGLSAVDPRSCGALMLQGDQPFVETGLIDALIRAFEAGRALVALPEYPGGGTGTPVLFSRRLFPELLAVTGDKGGREIVKNCLAGAYGDGAVARVRVLSALAGLDIDTMEEYNALAEKQEE
ncbi:MAG: NTP transferase domain-containing protein [Clostridiales Family XIII bacterium]|nr:NTP transferase domain-containing protein [Clostridiales Family XIII bacterium]